MCDGHSNSSGWPWEHVPSPHSAQVSSQSISSISWSQRAAGSAGQLLIESVAARLGVSMSSSRNSGGLFGQTDVTIGEKSVSLALFTPGSYRYARHPYLNLSLTSLLVRGRDEHFWSARGCRASPDRSLAFFSRRYTRFSRSRPRHAHPKIRRICEWPQRRAQCHIRIGNTRLPSSATWDRSFVDIGVGVRSGQTQLLRTATMGCERRRGGPCLAGN